MWPGFGDNLRVLEWMLKRAAGNADATDSAIGALPRPEDLNLKGLDIAPQTLQDLLTIDRTAWTQEVADMREYLNEFGARVPPEMRAELDRIDKRLKA